MAIKRKSRAQLDREIAAALVGPARPSSAKLTVKKADRIIRGAKLGGFGGDCGRVAIAINHVVFDGKGKYIAATNPPLNAKTGDFFMGHVVVEWNDRLFDATGVIDDETDVESYGMIDRQDPDVPVRLTEEEAEHGELHTLDEFGDLREQEARIGHFSRGRCSIRDASKALEKSKAAAG